MTVVALFGGSFDPPHVGHVLAAAYARGRGFERVLVVPVDNHAFGKQLAPFAHRLAMARLAFAPVAGAEVSAIESELAAPNFTLETVKALTARHPDWQLRLLIGSDVLRDTPNWNRFEEIRALAPPFVVDRAGVDGVEGALLPAVSSTAVRDALSRRERDERARAWLSERIPSAVLDYIDREKLYSSAAP
jgi:nicotinate-nucleotide adenylyltransferase